MSSPHHHQYPYLHGPAPAPSPPINDLTTLIALRGFVSGRIAFRRRASDFPTFNDIFVAAYEAWQNEPDDYRLHLHFRRGPEIECSREEILERADWDSGEYFIGGTIEIFAHFAEKQKARPERRVSSVSTRLGRGGHGGQELRPARRTKRRQNPDATTAYSLCMPTERQYFSAPFVFIPCPGTGQRVQLFPPRFAEPWTGFRFPQSMTGQTSVSVRRSSGHTAEAAPAPTHVYTPVERQPSESDDRMSSPEYGVVKEEEAELSGESIPHESVAPSRREFESLFVPERRESEGSEESEGLFVSE